MSVDGTAAMAAAATSAVAVSLLMAGCLAVAMRLGKLSVVDSVWGAGFALVAVTTWVSGELVGTEADVVARLLLLVLPLVWGLRLSVHLTVRNRGLPEDRRYVELVEAASGSAAAVATRRVFLPQGAAMWVVALPVTIGAATSDLWLPVAVVGVAVVGPVLLTWTLTRKTGAPTLERSLLERKPDYADYVRRTSGFLPRPPAVRAIRTSHHVQ